MTKKHTQKIIGVWDLLKDLDDEKCVLVLVKLQQRRIINTIGAIANLLPERERALALRGLLNMFGLKKVPVGIGFPVADVEKVHPYETNVPYFRYGDADGLIDGASLLKTQAELAVATGEGFTLLCCSGLTDAAHFLRTNPDLAKKALAGITIMGGVVTDGGHVMLDDEGFLQADVGESGAANNLFDSASSVFLHRRSQELGIPLTVLTRYAVAAAKMPFTFFAELEATGHEVGVNLMKRQIPALRGLWRRAALPIGDSGRGKLPDRCTREWYVGEFCGGIDPGIGATEDIQTTHLRGGYNEYDALALLGAIDSLRNRFFSPTIATVRDVNHLVIGVSAEKHGVRDVDAVRALIQESILSVLLS